MNEKLYIIGNGFDLHHKLRTSYTDFRENFAKSNRYIWNILSLLYGDKIMDDMWWYNFEEMLGRIDYQRLMNSHNGMALSSLKLKNFLTNNLPVLFGEWIRKVDDNIDPDNELMIDINSQYFTFNYTLLLEKSYNIKEQQIWHIHHSLADLNSGENLIVGHDSDFQQVFAYMNEYQKNKRILRDDIADSINQEVVKGAKKVANRINSDIDEFTSRYSHIKHYISMGFSYNEIDMPYIKKIVEVNNSFAESDWLLYSHSESEKGRLNCIMKQLGVSKEKVKIIDW